MNLSRLKKALLFISFFGLMPGSLCAVDFYVSLGGSDSNRGTEGAPFASFSAARDAARSVVGDEAVTVYVADGIYYLPETLVFSAPDTGTETKPVIYKAENEGGAVLSGDSLLKLTWEPYREAIYQAETPAGLEIDQLFVNGRNQRMARYPNFDAAKKAEPYQP